jgi:hypothetical protein
MFVHDFVAVERPALAVVDGFSRLQPSLGPIVLAAWNADRDLWTRLGMAYPEYAPSWPIHVEVGQARVRPDAVVIPLMWCSGAAQSRVALEADMEIAAFGGDLTHLHLLGRYAFPPSLDRWSAEASRAHRATVSAVRRFLQMMAEELTLLVAPAEPSRALQPAPIAPTGALRSGAGRTTAPAHPTALTDLARTRAG